jgi:hypothetical protein
LHGFYDGTQGYVSRIGRQIGHSKGETGPGQQQGGNGSYYPTGVALDDLRGKGQGILSGLGQFVFQNGDSRGGRRD